MADGCKETARGVLNVCLGSIITHVLTGVHAFGSDAMSAEKLACGAALNGTSRLVVESEHVSESDGTTESEGSSVAGMLVADVSGSEVATDPEAIFNCFDRSGAVGTVCDSVVVGAGMSKDSLTVLTVGIHLSLTSAMADGEVRFVPVGCHTCGAKNGLLFKRS